MTRRNIYVPDELWEEARRAAYQEAADAGEPASLSDWIRGAIRRRLEAEKTEQADDE